jgi:hypothetical protein
MKCPDRAGKRAGKANDRHSGRNVETERARGKRPVHEHGQCSAPGRLFDRLVGEPASRQQHGSTRNRAFAGCVEVASDSSGDHATRDRDDIGGHRLGRGSAERKDAVEQNAQAGANVHANGRRREPAVGGCHGQRGGRTPGPGDAPERRAGTTVVPGGCDDEHVECRRARDGARKRAVGEGGVRLGQPDERDAHGVVRVSVVVRVYRSLEPGEQLIGS